MNVLELELQGVLFISEFHSGLVNNILITIILGTRGTIEPNPSNE